MKGKMLIILWHTIECRMHPYFRKQKWKQKIWNVELMNYIQHCLLFFVSLNSPWLTSNPSHDFLIDVVQGEDSTGQNESLDPTWCFWFGCYKFQTYPPTHWHFWQECSLESTSLQKFHLNLVHLYEEAFGSGRDVQSPVIMKVHTNGRTHMPRLIKWYAQNKWAYCMPIILLESLLSRNNN